MVAVAVAGCDDGEERRNDEVALLVDTVHSIHHDAPVQVRTDLIDNLDQLTLTDDSLREVRQTCVEGHRALLTAEEQQHEATLALAAATDGDGDAPIPATKAMQIEASIRRSQDAVREAGELLTRCQDEVTDLEVRRTAHR